MNHQTVELGVCLGIALFGLVWANLNLWRVRRLFTRLPQGVRMPESASASSAENDHPSQVVAP